MPTIQDAFNGLNFDYDSCVQLDTSLFERLPMLWPAVNLKDHIIAALERRWGDKLGRVIDLFEELMEIEAGVDPEARTVVKTVVIHADYVVQSRIHYRWTIRINASAGLAETFDLPDVAERLFSTGMQRMWVVPNHASHAVTHSYDTSRSNQRLCFPSAADLQMWLAQVTTDIERWLDATAWIENIAGNTSAFDNSGVRPSRRRGLDQDDIRTKRRHVIEHYLVPELNHSLDHRFALRPETKALIDGSAAARRYIRMIDQHFLLSKVPYDEWGKHPLELPQAMREEVKQ